MTPGLLRLYLVADAGVCGRTDLAGIVAAAVRGGATLVQLRDKSATTTARIDAARALKQALAGTGVPLVVNDDLDAALAAEADGLHVGQDDLSPAAARARLGPDRLLGLSCETLETVRAAPEGIVDYLGIGPVFATGTKPDHKPAIGIEGLARLCAATPLPCVAIGGLDASHAGAVRAAGAEGMALVSAICAAPDPEAATRAIARALAEARP